MCVNSESDSNEIDESNLQYEKHDEQRIWTWRGIVINTIGALSNEPLPIRVTFSVPTSHGKKTDEGTIMLPSTPESNQTTVAESPKTQTLTPAMTNEASDILIKCVIKFCGAHKIESSIVRPDVDLCCRPPTARRLSSSRGGCLCFRDFFCEFCPSPTARLSMSRRTASPSPPDVVLTSNSCWSVSSDLYRICVAVFNGILSIASSVPKMAVMSHCLAESLNSTGPMISSDKLRLRFESELVRHQPSRTPIVTKTPSAISSASRTQTVMGVRCKTVHHFPESVNAIGSYLESPEFVNRIYSAIFTPSRPKLVHQPPIGALRW
jgi:hypothetical protein